MSQCIAAHYNYRGYAFFHYLCILFKLQKHIHLLTEKKKGKISNQSKFPIFLQKVVEIKIQYLYKGNLET